MTDRTGPGNAGELRALLDSVLDALTLPHDLDDYDARILRRAGLARVVVRCALDENPANIGWNADHLSAQLVAESYGDLDTNDRGDDR
ncbi:hypothetical protein QNO09_34350 [Streptomyces sp. 378]|uniref:hypothetical protein n=1 Tax=Streptomyces sp. 378 TaxID=3049412 RepID=UPI0024C22A83|nr:hypothetical protein [Streptomyces sp. 378]MDK1348272.1 hypothetical protein [Streptomyces sp. 378]